MKKLLEKFLGQKKVFIILEVITLLLIIALIVVFIFLKPPKEEEKKVENNIKEPEEKISIIDINSKSRPYAVMINNHPDARAHHAGLQDAYIVYELIVEGGMTRYLALFKDQTTEKIGSVRSSRHYFLDYALENDAIYVHWGWSPQAQSDIKTLGINNINGLTYEGTYFYRDKSLNVSLEHTGFTNMELLKKATEKLKYRTTTDNENLFDYSAKEIDLSKQSESVVANNVAIKYSNSLTTSYTYNSETKNYNRFVNNKEHIDDITKEQYTAKNIIVYEVDNYTIKGDEKGRQNFDNLGSGEGYYITDGYATKINWSKECRACQTKYTYLNGEEIVLNDGNTYIQIEPKGQGLSLS